MVDWWKRWLQFNVTAKLTMIASVAMSWRCAEWFMNLEDPTTQERISQFLTNKGIFSGFIFAYIHKHLCGEEEGWMSSEMLDALAKIKKLRIRVFTRISIKPWSNSEQIQTIDTYKLNLLHDFKHQEGEESKEENIINLLYSPDHFDRLIAIH